jgi:hypothetical protein
MTPEKISRASVDRGTHSEASTPQPDRQVPNPAVVAWVDQLNLSMRTRIPRYDSWKPITSPATNPFDTAYETGSSDGSDVNAKETYPSDFTVPLGLMASLSLSGANHEQGDRANELDNEELPVSHH